MVVGGGGRSTTVWAVLVTALSAVSPSAALTMFVAFLLLLSPELLPLTHTPLLSAIDPAGHLAPMADWAGQTAHVVSAPWDGLVAGARARARLYRKAYGVATAAVSLSRLRDRVAYRRLGAHPIVYPFRDVDGRLVEGFGAAPRSLRGGGGLVYSAQWAGVCAQAAAAATELAVVRRTRAG